MKRKLIVVLLILSLFIVFNTTAFALPYEQTSAIQSLIDEAQRISGAPGISVAVSANGETYYFSSGLANREMEVPASEDTLWELASVSKAFTALGLLYLEEQGLLSLTDSIAHHVPWLTFQYKGQSVDMQNVRLYHFLYHTVGITNLQHINLILNREGPDTIKNTVEALIDAELAFSPGERMEYGTKNYIVLGLVIESVSGQSYENFMEERIFQPLGLTQTFANRDHATATGNFAQGYINTFIFATLRRDSPEARGSVPTGYIITSAKDMARWMEIQLGMKEDIPAIFKEITPRSHIGNQSVEADYFMGRYFYYAAGWMICVDGNSIEHGGDNPSFVTYVRLLPEEQIGITILSNSTAGNVISIADNITEMLRGHSGTRYSLSMIQLLDIVFTIITVLGSIFTIVFFLLGLRKKRQGNKKRTISKKRMILIALWSVITLIIGISPHIAIGGVLIVFLLMWMPYSLLTGLIILTLLCGSITWFVVFPRRMK